MHLSHEMPIIIQYPDKCDAFGGLIVDWFSAYYIIISYIFAPKFHKRKLQWIYPCSS